MNEQELKAALLQSDRQVEVRSRQLRQAVFAKQAVRRTVYRRLAVSGLILCTMGSFAVAWNLSNLVTIPTTTDKIADFDESLFIEEPVESDDSGFESLFEMRRKMKDLLAVQERLNSERSEQMRILSKERISRAEIELPKVALIEF